MRGRESAAPLIDKYFLILTCLKAVQHVSLLHRKEEHRILTDKFLVSEEP